MTWIDIDDDIPPKGTRVLVNAYLCHDSEVALIVDALWSPSKGWLTYGHKNHIDTVLSCHPLNVEPPHSKNVRPRSSVESPIVSEIQADSP